MTAEQALSDLTEISSQVEAAALFDAKGKVAASTLADGEPFVRKKARCSRSRTARRKPRTCSRSRAPR